MDVRLPYASRRMPVLGRNVVATSQPLAASAGLRMLQSGGNAVDAAIAMAIALTVVEPTSNGIGGDAFAIVWDGERLHGLNASGRSPGGLTPERFAGMDVVPSSGEDSLTTPGAVSAWTALHGRFGRIPFETLFAPALAYARDGFPVSPVTAAAWKKAERAFGHRPDFRSAFLPKGRAPAAGDIWRFSDQADSLQRIAETRGETFYQGALATQIASHVRSGGGLLGEEDLFSHQPEWVNTISTPWQGTDVHEIPPNGQGLAALIALGILRHTDVAATSVDSVDATHLQIEAMKLAFADAYRYVAEPYRLRVRPEALLREDYLAERAAKVDLGRAQDPVYGVPAPAGTVYLAAADAEGRMVSYIQSNYQGFGSGVVVPGTGIALQNRAAGFTLEEGHPNQVGPAKRPFHTIIPGFVMREGAPRSSFGVMGGSMQPQGHVQMVLRTLTWGQNPQAASDAPRWRVLHGLEVAVEEAMPDEMVAGLEARGHRVRRAAPDAPVTFGGAQLIERLPQGGYVAGSDSRKDGQALGC